MSRLLLDPFHISIVHDDIAGGWVSGWANNHKPFTSCYYPSHEGCAAHREIHVTTRHITIAHNDLLQSFTHHHFSRCSRTMVFISPLRAMVLHTWWAGHL